MIHNQKSSEIIRALAPQLIFQDVDICHQPLQRHGFFRALQYALRVTENGLMHGGPPCSSFVWVNRATSGRGRDQPDGRDGVRSVFTANKPFGVCSRFCV